MSAAILAVGGAALAACVTAPTPAAVAEPAPAVTIGGADADGGGFVDWHGATAHPAIIMGIQGGQHIWLVVRASKQFYFSKMRMYIDMTDLDSGEVVKPGQIPFTRTLSDQGDVWVSPAVTAYVKEPCKISDHRVKVRVAVEDLVGLTASDEVVVIPSWSGFCPR